MASGDAALQFQFATLSPSLHLIETEDSWQKIEAALNKLEQLTKGGAYKQDAFVPLIKEHAAPIVSALLSERTKLSGTAADLLNSVAPRLAGRFDALTSTLVPPLLQLCARTNKVALVRAKKCLLLIAKHCKLPSLLPYLSNAARDKSSTLRNVSVELVLTLLESIENADRIGKRVTDVESVIRSTATDRDPEVRQWCKRTFEMYTTQWPTRVLDFTASFTPTTKRYLATSEAKLHGIATGSSGPATLSNLAERKPLHRIHPNDAPHSNKGSTDQVQSSKARTNVESHTMQQSRNVSGTKRPAVLDFSSPPKKQTERHVNPASRSTSDHIRHRNATSSNREPQSSSSNSSSSMTNGVHTEGAANGGSKAAPTVVVVPTDPEDERERAALRAEVFRQSAATPSRGIAARLALEQFEMRLKGKSGGSDEHVRSTAATSSRAALTAFAVAAAKKHSPRRLPARIPLATTQTSVTAAQAQIERQASVSMPQRVTKPADASSASASTRKTPEPPRSPDVFESRPFPKAAASSTGKSKAMAGSSSATGKRTSTLSKGMSARGKLLGSTPIVVAPPLGAAQKRSTSKANAGAPQASLSSPSKFFTVPLFPMQRDTQMIREEVSDVSGERIIKTAKAADQLARQMEDLCLVAAAPTVETTQSEARNLLIMKSRKM